MKHPFARATLVASVVFGTVVGTGAPAAAEGPDDDPKQPRINKCVDVTANLPGHEPVLDATACTPI